MKPVARAGDVSPTPSSATNYPDDKSPTATGSWAAAGNVSETPASGATSDGKKIIVSATCDFVFSGTTKVDGAPFTSSPPSTVTLSPASRTLKVGGDPLVDGDEKTDTYGNKLSVSSTATWQTA